MVVGVLLTIDIAILSTWQIIDPFFRETKLLAPYVSNYSIRAPRLLHLARPHPKIKRTLLHSIDPSHLRSLFATPVPRRHISFLTTSRKK